MKRGFFNLTFILLFSLIIVSAASGESVLKSDDVYLGIVSDNDGSGFILSESGGTASGTFVNPNYIQRIDFENSFFPFQYSGQEIVVLHTEVANQFQLIVNGKILGKFDIDPSYSPNDFYLMTDKDGNGGAIIVFLSKDLQKTYVQFIRSDGNVFPNKPLLVRNHKSTLNDYFWYFISDNAGGAIFYWSSNNDEKSEFIFVKADGSIFPGFDNPAVLNVLLPSIISSDVKSNAVFVSSDFNIGINLHFYDGEKDTIIPITNSKGPSSFISNEKNGFIVLWDDRARLVSPVSAVFIGEDNSVSKPTILAAPDFGSISNFISDGLGGAIIVFLEHTAEWDGTSVQFLHSDGTVSGPFHAVSGTKLAGVVADGHGGIIILYQEDTEFRIKFISSKGEVSYIKTFFRGDANNDGKADLADAVFILNYLFKGGNEPSCLDATDVNDNGIIDLTDAIYLLNHLFLGGPALPEPYLKKGFDGTIDQISCIAMSA